MTTGMIHGMQQVVEYNSADTRVYYTVKGNRGREVAPDSAPNIVIKNSGGTELVASTAMTMSSIEDEGLLAYDAQSAEFTVGEIVTGGTSGATGKIIDDDLDGTSGVLRLINIDGTFQNNEALTDSGGGAATVDGTLYTTEYYYALDTTTTDNYPVGEDYIAEITYLLSTVTYNRTIYFDCAYSPMSYPIVTNADVNRIHPEWLGRLPNSWKDWTNAIKQAHGDLVRRIHAHGELSQDYCKRETEFWRIAMAFTEAQISQSCNFPSGERDDWEKNKQSAWAERGLLKTNADEDPEIEDGGSGLLSPGFTR